MIVFKDSFETEKIVNFIYNLDKEIIQNFIKNN